MKKLLKNEDGLRVAENTFVLNLTLGSIRTRARVRGDAVQKMAAAIVVEGEADGDELHVSKELLRRPEVKAVVDELQDTRELVRRHAQPVKFLKGGLYLYAATQIAWVNERIKAAQERVDELLKELEEAWPVILEEDKKRLTPLGLYDARDYPTLAAVREAARIRYNWLRFETPTGLAKLSEALFEEEREKAKSMWAEVFDSIRAANIEATQGFVDGLLACLKPEEGTKARVLRQATVERFTEFLAEFRIKDVTGFEDLAKLVDRARSFMKGVDAEVLRTEGKAAERVAEGLAELRDALKPLAEEATRRVKLRE